MNELGSAGEHGYGKSPYMRDIEDRHKEASLAYFSNRPRWHSDHTGGSSEAIVSEEVEVVERFPVPVAVGLLVICTVLVVCSYILGQNYREVLSLF